MEMMTVSMMLLLPYITFILLGRPATGERSCAREMFVLGNEGSQATIRCSAFGSQSSSLVWYHDEETINVDGIKYVQSFNRLRINNIVAADEGSYSCSCTGASRDQQDATCIYVLGKAVFATCADSLGNCMQIERINVCVGEEAVFDTRITFVGAGRSNRNQTITLLELVKGSCTNGRRLYVCSNLGQNQYQQCSSTDQVVIQSGAHKFDIRMILPPVSLEDSGIFCARAEVINPETGATAIITKSFNLAVEDKVPFQIRIGPLEPWTSWNMQPERTRTVEAAVRNEVAEAIATLCNCSFPLSIIQVGRLSCRNSPFYVTYRSILVGTETYTANELLDFVQSWVQMSPTVTIDLVVVNVDANCPVSISDTECSSPYPMGSFPSNYTDAYSGAMQCIDMCLYVLDSSRCTK